MKKRLRPHQDILVLGIIFVLGALILASFTVYFLREPKIPSQRSSQILAQKATALPPSAAVVQQDTGTPVLPTPSKTRSISVDAPLLTPTATPLPTPEPTLEPTATPFPTRTPLPIVDTSLFDRLFGNTKNPLACDTQSVWVLPIPKRIQITATFGVKPRGSEYYGAIVGTGVISDSMVSIFHPGIDLYALPGTPLYAVREGIVEFTGYNNQYGNHVILQVQGMQILYAHLSQILTKPGISVFCGQTIGLSGASGKSITGAHLHFEVRQSGQPIDPYPFLKRSLAK